MAWCGRRGSSWRVEALNGSCTTSASRGTARPAVAWLALVVFFLAAVLSYTDRLILNLLVDPIRHDLGISDVQVSYLQGAAFAVIYSLVGLPLGRFADKHNRRNVIAAGIVLWSIATASCGYVGSFQQFFLARIFVGIGEAALAPAVMSMIPDLFPPAMRGTAIAIFLAGMAIGGGVSISVGGLLLGQFSNGALAAMPILGHLAPWRAVLVSLALPGLAIAALIACLPEPPRLERSRNVTRADIAETLGFFRRHAALFSVLFGGFALMQVVDYGLVAWLPTLLIRKFAVAPAVAGPRIGEVAIVFGGLGTLLGGWLPDRLLARGMGNARIHVALVSYLLTMPTLLFPVQSSTHRVLLWYAAYAFLANMGTCAGFAATQDAVRAEMRGFSVSLQAMAYTLFGLGCGPTAVAATTEYLYRSPSQVGIAMTTVAIPAAVAAVLLLAIAVPRYRSIQLVLAEERDAAPLQ